MGRNVPLRELFSSYNWNNITDALIFKKHFNATVAVSAAQINSFSNS